MPISINDINALLEEHIHIGNIELKEKLGRIKKGNIVVFDRKKNNETIIELLKIFQPNWIGGHKKTLFYNLDENLKIENYLFAVSMNREVPNDIFDEIIDKNEQLWYQYKHQMKDKNIYIKNGTNSNITNDLSNANYKLGPFEIIIVTANNISNSEMTYLKNVASKDSCILLIVDNYDELKKHFNNNVKGAN